MQISANSVIAYIILFNVVYVAEHFSGCGDADSKYNTFPEAERLQLKEQVKKMFYFGYDSYMKYAFPQDELNPIFCSGRGPDYENPSNININDVLGDYSLTLIDTLDTLAIMGNSSEFKNAVSLVLDYVSFDRPSTVQVFEATIRVLGGLLAAHLIITDPLQPFGDMVPPDYDGEILLSAHDLANRLLAAFENTTFGIPHPRVNLRDGVPREGSMETCLAGAGTLLLEFGVLSRLLGDPTFEGVARKAVRALWSLRSNHTGLFGNILNMQTGEWVGQISGIGAGMDSFYEYLLKSYIMFGEQDDLKKFNDIYKSINNHMRKGRSSCTHGEGDPPLFVNVHMNSGKMANNWIDSLQAAFAGVQVLKGDIDEAICMHALYYTIWRKYGALPERFNWLQKSSEIHFYPLRPELVESTYFLYQATHHPFYLHVGRDILQSLEKHAKAKCGYATLHNVMDKSQEDRMESFFLSETCKYLYLLFDDENHLNQDASNYIFTTEGHILRLDNRYRRRPWEFKSYKEKKHKSPSYDRKSKRHKPAVKTYNESIGCVAFNDMRHQSFPLDISYLKQIEALVGLESS